MANLVSRVKYSILYTNINLYNIALLHHSNFSGKFSPSLIGPVVGTEFCVTSAVSPVPSVSPARWDVSRGRVTGFRWPWRRHRGTLRPPLCRVCWHKPSLPDVTWALTRPGFIGCPRGPIGGFLTRWPQIALRRDRRRAGGRGRHRVSGGCAVSGRRVALCPGAIEIDRSRSGANRANVKWLVSLSVTNKLSRGGGSWLGGGGVVREEV